MSVAIATKGLFATCRMSRGGPNITQLSEKQRFAVKVNKVYFRDIKKKDKGLKILIKHITIDDF